MERITKIYTSVMYIVLDGCGAIDLKVDICKYMFWQNLGILHIHDSCLRKSVEK